MSTAPPVEVALAEIRFVADAWPRQYLDEERVEDFAALYREHGPEVLPPIELVPYGPSRYLIGDGVHRVQAARRAGLTSLPAYIVTPPA
jgi:ParB family chromosome partitioning protein